jgi:hypothetical protein
MRSSKFEWPLNQISPSKRDSHTQDARLGEHDKLIWYQGCVRSVVYVVRAVFGGRSTRMREDRTADGSTTSVAAVYYSVVDDLLRVCALRCRSRCCIRRQ